VSRILLIAPAGWHAPDVAKGLYALGHDVYFAGEPRVRFGERTALRVANRLTLIAPAVSVTIGAVERLLALVAEPDLIVAWSSFALASEFARRAPVIVVRGSTHIRRQRETLSRGPRASKPSWPAVWLEETEYRRADRITVPTELIARDRYWRRQQVAPVVTPYGFPTPRPASARRNRPKHGLRLIFGGALGVRKGIDRLALLLRSRHELVESFHLYGKRRRLDVLPALPRWWQVHSTLGRDAWFAALDQADLLVLPSREEGMARVGQDAMACGVPVLATPEAGLGLWLERGAGIELPYERWLTEFWSTLDRIQAEWPTLSKSAKAVAGSWTWRDHAELLLTQARLS
jgi:glycosyltransferase involved in cell wall biosynthesis